MDGVGFCLDRFFVFRAIGIKQMNNFTVDESLYYVPDATVRRGDPEYVTISRVGRTWLYCISASFGGIKVDIATLAVDGGKYSSPGQCWLSQFDYEQHCLLAKSWRNFTILVKHHPTKDGVSVDDIQEATRLLFACRDNK